jgi:MFS transporter, FSR family, fosmidomycin resistance protein
MFTRQNSATYQRTRNGVSGALLAILLTVAHIANDAITSMLNTLLPSLQLRYDFSATTLALLIAAFSFSSSVTQPLFGALSDRLGHRALAVVGLLLSVSLLSLMAVVPSAATLFAVLLIGGLGSAAFHPAGNSLARTWSGRKDFAVSLFSAGGMIGLALGPVLVLLLASTFGLGFTPWLMVPGILLGLLVQLVAPARTHHAPPQQVRLFDKQVLFGPVGKLVVAGTLLEVGFVTFTAAMPLWLVARGGLAVDDPLIGLTLTCFYVASAIGGLLAGWLARFVPRRILMLLTLLLAPAPLVGVFASSPQSPWFLLIVALAGLLVNASFPLLIVTAQDLAPNAEATAAGMLGGLTVGAAGVLYVGIGALQTAIGLQAAMTLAYLLLIPAGLLTYRVLARHKELDRQPPDANEIVGCACSSCGNANVCLCAEGRLCQRSA